MEAISIIHYRYLFLILVLLFSLSFLVSAQTKWYKYPSNLEFHSGQSERYWRSKSEKVVVYDNGQYRMWYLESDNYREFHTYTSSSVNEFLAWDTDKMMKPQKEIIVEVFGKIEYIKVTSN